ncbi:MAG: choice-of-anchor I family protein [Alcanivoracaceae bacterium]|nr:choice-of-anchor I family protein [Alcanivoracaceae bacterium]
MHDLQKYACALMVAVAITGCGGKSDSDDSSSGGIATPDSITLTWLGRYSSNTFGASAAEITAYDAVTQRAFVVNAQAGLVDVLDLSDPANPSLIDTLSADDIAANLDVNSVAVKDGLVALAVQATNKTDPGYVAVYSAEDLEILDYAQIGAQPDMVTFTPDGHYILLANEGEPSDDYSVDPEGSVSVVDVTNPLDLVVTTATFTSYNAQINALRASGVRVYGPNATVAQDMEPEYIAVSADSTTAWVTLQENNAIAKVDIGTAQITDIFPLGYKDHGVAGNGLDANDEDGAPGIATFAGLRGLYLPDSIVSYDVNGATYLVTANEGDARAWGEDTPAYWGTENATPCDGDTSKGFVEEFRIKHLVHKSGFDRRCGDDLPAQLREISAGALLNPSVFGYCGAVAGDPMGCRDDEHFGRLNITWTMGYQVDEMGAPVMYTAAGVEDSSGDRIMYDALYSYGGRSFSIWDEDGALVWDSGDAIESFLASEECKLGSMRNINCADYFNANHEEGDTLDNRSDNKGPEPEGLAVGTIGSKTFAFVGLERMGGVLVYDITNPAAPQFQDYLNSREEWDTEDPSTILATVGDLGPEGLHFISAADAPNGEALLIVGNEVSGSTAVFRVEQHFNQ